MSNYSQEYLRWLIDKYKIVSGDPTIFCTEIPNDEYHIKFLIRALSFRTEEEREKYIKSAEMIVDRIQKGETSQNLREEIWLRKNIADIK